MAVKKGSLTPTQFTTCLSELLINIFPCSSSCTTAGTASASLDDEGGQKTCPTGVVVAAGNGEEVSQTTGPPRRETQDPVLEYSNGAMEALRLSHEEFLALLASELASQMSQGSSPQLPTRSKRKRQSGGNNDYVISRDADDDKKAKDQSMSRIINEKDVLSCLEALGFGRIGQEAMDHIDSSNDFQQDKNRDHKKKEGTTTRREAATRKKKRKIHISDQMIAEQERLLAASAQKLLQQRKQEEKIGNSAEMS